MDGGDAARMMMRYAGYGDVFHAKAIINPIMMRFRPIAPKPVAGGSLPGGSSVDGKHTLISKGRAKRKYVRVRRYNRKKKTTTITTDNNNNGELNQAQPAVTTLQLLPESRDGVDTRSSGSSPPDSRRKVTEGNQTTEPSYLYSYRNGNSKTGKDSDVQTADPTDTVRRTRAGELWVTVECVTDPCMDYLQQLQDLGSTDEERTNKLEEDTCPGFISDGLNRVEWLNKAFKRMVRQKQRQRQRQRQRSDSESSTTEEEAEIAVWLISKEPRLPYLSRGFTCQIKLQYKWGMEMDKDSKVVPCDVWRMDGGGFAWKLDVKAALTLGPSLQELNSTE